MGLVNAVAEQAASGSTRRSSSRRVIATRPAARRAARQAGGARRRGDRRSRAGLEQERRLYELAMATEDRVEGMQAFLEKRKPEFTGAS